jgi:hypothetical protein
MESSTSATRAMTPVEARVTVIACYDDHLAREREGS